jgi:uncharacterized protein involved in exopolysaccharide biosynthesis
VQLMLLASFILGIAVGLLIATLRYPEAPP